MSQYTNTPEETVTRVKEGYGKYAESMPELDEHTYAILSSIEKFGCEAWLSNLKDDLDCKRYYLDNHLPKIEGSTYVSHEARGPAGKQERYFVLHDEGRAALREYERRNGELTPADRRMAEWTRAEKKEVYEWLEDNERDARFFREELLQAVGDSEVINTSDTLPVKRLVELLEQVEMIRTISLDNRDALKQTGVYPPSEQNDNTVDSISQ